MPIEIRELVIRATVEPPPRGEAGDMREPEDQAKLVQRCVDEVLKVLRRRREP